MPSSIPSRTVYFLPNVGPFQLRLLRHIVATPTDEHIASRMREALTEVGQPYIPLSQMNVALHRLVGLELLSSEKAVWEIPNKEGRKYARHVVVYTVTPRGYEFLEHLARQPKIKVAK